MDIVVFNRFHLILMCFYFRNEEFEGKKLWRNPDSHLISVMKEIGNK